MKRRTGKWHSRDCAHDVYRITECTKNDEPYMILNMGGSKDGQPTRLVRLNPYIKWNE
jgi:hypothetical protein